MERQTGMFRKAVLGIRFGGVIQLQLMTKCLECDCRSMWLRTKKVVRGKAVKEISG